MCHIDSSYLFDWDGDEELHDWKQILERVQRRKRLTDIIEQRIGSGDEVYALLHKQLSNLGVPTWHDAAETPDDSFTVFQACTDAGPDQVRARKLIHDRLAQPHFKNT